MIHFLEATVKRSEENQYRSWGYCTYEVQWNDHSFKITIFYSKILGEWNRRFFSGGILEASWTVASGGGVRWTPNLRLGTAGRPLESVSPVGLRAKFLYRYPIGQ